MKRDPFATPEAQLEAIAKPGEMTELHWLEIRRANRLRWIVTWAVAIPLGLVALFFLGWILGVIAVGAIGLGVYGLGGALFPASRDHGSINYHIHGKRRRLDQARARMASHADSS